MLNASAIGVSLLLGAVLTGAVIPAQHAQQSVKDGPVGDTAFTSPMVLTAKFPALDPSSFRNGEWFTLDEHRQLSTFTCDGVSLKGDVDRGKKTTEPGLEFAAKMRADGHAEVKIRVALWNPPHNHDKSGTVMLEVPRPRAARSAGRPRERSATCLGAGDGRRVARVSPPSRWMRFGGQASRGSGGNARTVRAERATRREASRIEPRFA